MEIAKAGAGSLTQYREPASEKLRAEATLGVFKLSPTFFELRAKLLCFMDDHVYPNEATYMAQHKALIKSTGSQWYACQLFHCRSPCTCFFLIIVTYLCVYVYACVCVRVCVCVCVDVWMYVCTRICCCCYF